MEPMVVMAATRATRPRNRIRRTGLAAAALAGLSLVTTACSAGSPGPGTVNTGRASPGGPPQGGLQGPQGPGFTMSPQRRAEVKKLVACMRSHGVPNFPDPTSQQFPTQMPDPSSPAYKSAQNACKAFGPGNGQAVMPGG